jgi:FlaA1/EpsC-like NDP-sugar epimerase
VTDGRCPLAFLRARLPKYLVAADDRRRPDVEWDVPRVTHAGPESNWRDARQVFLTGATGFLGAHLLRELLDRTDARIHALVRGRDLALQRPCPV